MAAEVAGHLQDIVLGGTTSESGLLQGCSRLPTLRKAALLERGGFYRDVPAWSLRLGSAEDSARQAASFAFGRAHRNRELAVYHAVADGRKVGGSRKAPSVSTLSPIQDKSLRVGGLVDEGWGLQPEREQGQL